MKYRSKISQQPEKEQTSMNKSHLGHLATAVYVASVPLANWMIGHVGTNNGPGRPHTIPLLIRGLSAPSGVLAIGVALVARDAVHEHFGTRSVVAAMAVGVALSYLVNPALAVASAAAFALGEGADLVVYAPLRHRNKPLGVAASGVVGGALDSLSFLWIAFGSFAFWQGQVLAKATISIIAGVALAMRRASVRRAVV